MSTVPRRPTKNNASKTFRGELLRVLPVESLPDKVSWDWHAWAMRLYLPLTLTELSADSPPTRDGLTASTDVPESEGSLLEEVLEETLQEAAFVSLELARSLNAPPCRVVAVGDVPAGRTQFSDWGEVQSLMRDGSEGQELARQVFTATQQESADSLLEQLFEEDLEWFDGSERNQIGEC